MASLLSPKVPLFLFSLYYLCGFFWILFDPESLLEFKQFKVRMCPDKSIVDLGNAGAGQEGCVKAALGAISVFQTTYVSLFFYLGAGFITAARVGQDALSVLNFFVAVGIVYHMIEYFPVLPQAQEVITSCGGDDVPTWGIVLWWVLAVIILILILLSVNFMKLKPNIRGWCSTLNICPLVVSLCLFGKWISMRFFSEKLAEYLGFEETYKIQHDFVELIIVCLCQPMVMLILFLLGVIYSGDRMVAYSVNRVLAVGLMFQLVFYFVTDDLWDVIGHPHTKRDKACVGVGFLILIGLAWVPVIRLDRAVGKAFENKLRNQSYEDLREGQSGAE